MLQAGSLLCRATRLTGIDPVHFQRVLVLVEFEIPAFLRG